MIKKTLCLLVLAALTGCVGNPKPKPPVTPTPPPVVETGRPATPIYTNLVLRTENGRLILNGGAPFRMVGAIPCWPESDDPGSLKVDGKSVDYDWALVGISFMDAVKAKGVNAVHIRLLQGGKMCCGLESIGGPYNPDGTWNEKYWAQVHKVIRHAGELGFIVEIDVTDGWVLKHCIWGDPVCPLWPAQDLHGAASLPLNASLSHWIQKVVEETKFYGNVVYQIGNENEGVPGWSPEWERAQHALIRSSEAGAVVHMIGSCTRDFEGPYDYFVSHDTDPVDTPISGRPLWVNEWNPSKTAAKFKVDCDAALAKGSACWLWRSDAKDDVWQASLDSINAASAAYLCGDPVPNRDLLVFAVNCDHLYGGSCDATPLSVGDHEYCVAIEMPKNPDGFSDRYNCPMRNEGKPDRLTCEQYVMQSPAPLWYSDGVITFVDQNHFRVRTTGTWVEACDATGKHCTRVNFPR